MSVLRQSWLVVVAALVFAVTFWFRPGGVEGPRPEPVPVEGKGFDYSGLTEVLGAVVGADGQVDYAALQADPGPLDRYLGQVRAVGPANAPHRFKSADDRLAYYLNAYNAFVLAAVRDHCPLDSVDALYRGGGFYWRVSFLMGGDEVTLSTLETERIREVAKGNPLVHFALQKGAMGYPPLGREAYQPERLSAQLDALGERIAGDPRFVERAGDTLRLSTLFRDHGGGFEPSVEGWIGQRNPAAVEGKPTIEYRAFDASLNGRCR